MTLRWLPTRMSCCSCTSSCRAARQRRRYSTKSRARWARTRSTRRWRDYADCSTGTACWIARNLQCRATRRDSISSWRCARAAPTGVNRRVGDAKRDIDARIEKTAADMIVPFGRLAEMMRIYRDGYQRRGLDFAIWGHISDGNLHPNVLPRSYADVTAGKDAILEFGREAARLGGCPLAEHGVGRKFREAAAAPPDVRSGRALRVCGPSNRRSIRPVCWLRESSFPEGISWAQSPRGPHSSNPDRRPDCFRMPGDTAFGATARRTPGRIQLMCS